MLSNDDIDIEEAFTSEAYSFQEAVNSFGKVVHNIHHAYENDEFNDWPTVLLSTLLQTTALSLYQLLPKIDSQQSKGIVDRRSIASLIRNLVDTHDTLDLLCHGHQSADKFHLHRDIMGYYLSGKLHAAHGKTDATGFFRSMNKTREWYWSMIRKAIPDKAQCKRIKKGESLFYMTRKERLKKSCGEHAHTVGIVLSDLSTYVHSVPPNLWMKPLGELFADDRKTRGVLTVWLRIANFYFAKSIDIVLASAPIASTEIVLKQYIEQNREVFRTKKGAE